VSNPYQILVALYWRWGGVIFQAVTGPLRSTADDPWRHFGNKSYQSSIKDRFSSPAWSLIVVMRDKDFRFRQLMGQMLSISSLIIISPIRYGDVEGNLQQQVLKPVGQLQRQVFNKNDLVNDESLLITVRPPDASPVVLDREKHGSV
jgi:hypothetical protein